MRAIIIVVVVVVEQAGVGVEFGGWRARLLAILSTNTLRLTRSHFSSLWASECHNLGDGYRYTFCLVWRFFLDL